MSIQKISIMGGNNRLFTNVEWISSAGIIPISPSDSPFCWEFFVVFHFLYASLSDIR